MAADALVSYITRPTAPMVFTIQTKLAIIFHEKGFQLPVQFQFWKIIEKVNIHLCFLEMNSAQFLRPIQTYILHIGHSHLVLVWSMIIPHAAILHIDGLVQRRHDSFPCENTALCQNWTKISPMTWAWGCFLLWHIMACSQAMIYSNDTRIGSMLIVQHWFQFGSGILW